MSSLAGHGRALAPRIGPTDQSILADYFKDRGITAASLFPTNFMNLSKESYPLPWLAREIIQNFVDGDGQKPTNLNGVDFKQESISGRTQRFTVTGNWRFDKPESLCSLSTGKEDASVETAGGNGIGLKQTALRFMRDFGVTRFEIQGDEWNVNYRILSKEEVARARKPDGSSYDPLGSNWLVATVTAAESRSYNTCIIESDNSEVIGALSTMSELGVSDKNQHTKNLHFLGKYGGIKWLFPEGGESGDTVAIGKCYANGQIARCQPPPDSPDSDFWSGPQGVTVVFSNYSGVPRSIDRAPYYPSNINRMFNDCILSQMSRDELVKQLGLTESIWPYNGRERFPENHEAKHGFLSWIVWKLGNESDYTIDAFERDFPGRKYVTGRREALSDREREGIEKEGLTLLPVYFEHLGIPSTEKLFPKKVNGTDPSPTAAGEVRLSAAREQGVEVGFRDLSEITSPSDLAYFLRRAFGKHKPDIVVEGSTSDGEREIRILLSNVAPFSPSLLIHQLTRPNGDSQSYLFDLRGVIARALELHVAARATTLFEGGALSYVAQRDDDTGLSSLYVRLMEETGALKHCSLRFHVPESEKGREFVEALTGELPTEISQRLWSIGHYLSDIKFPTILQFGAVGSLVSVAAGVLLFSPSLTSKFYSTSPAPLDIKELIRQYDIANGRVNEADGSPGSAAYKRKLELLSELHKLSADDPDIDKVEGLTEIKNPTEVQTRKLRLLISTFEKLSGITVTSRTFIYHGKGSLGINLGGKAIGFNETVFTAGVSLQEALQIACHEVAHSSDVEAGHNPKWQHAFQVINAKLHSTLFSIMRKQAAGQPLTSYEAGILGAQEEWNNIK